MARPKAFDPDTALAAGTSVFARQGFHGTTTDDLAQAMGIGRQSLYSTFGDKRACYLRALTTYVERDVAASIDALRTPDAPLEQLRALLYLAVSGRSRPVADGCLAVNAAAEHGGTDAGISSILRQGASELQQAVTACVREACSTGDLPSGLDVEVAAAAILATRTGLIVAGQMGTAPSELQALADFTVERLTLDVHPRTR